MTDSTMNTHAGIDQSAAGRQTRTNTKTYDIVYVADANTGQFVGKMSRDEFLGQKKLHNGTADF